ncbi:MAG: hypothetical protein QMC73_15220 [Myxococcota bacterium]|jgi:hypothetical protein
MQKTTGRSMGRIVVAAMALVFAFGIGTAEAKSKSKVKLARDARLLAFDTEAGTMTVKERGKKVVYDVKFEGSVLKRTTATINSKPVKLTEIPLKAPVNIYWLPDEADKKKRFARKVDALKIPKELLED